MIPNFIKADCKLVKEIFSLDYSRFQHMPFFVGFVVVVVLVAKSILKLSQKESIWIGRDFGVGILQISCPCHSYFSANFLKSFAQNSFKFHTRQIGQIPFRNCSCVDTR